MKPSVLGYITTGSLLEGFTMRFDDATDIESIKTGRFVCIQGTKHKFFSMITDIKLETSHPDIMTFPPRHDDFLLKQSLLVHSMFSTAQLKPMLMIDHAQTVGPVKTIPYHFAQVFSATARDVENIFGSESDASKKYFYIGTPLDMDTPVCIDMDKLNERSNGVFGKTGTGKTFITRLLLAGLLKSEKASCLIFDMHNEYGLQARQEGSQTFVKGLKTLFPAQVIICSLDPQATQRRGCTPDLVVTLSYQDIEVDDILSLQQELNLHATAVDAAYLLYAKFKKQWLQVLLEQGHDAKELAAEIGAHTESLSALYRKLKRIERLPFFVPHATQNVVEDMIAYIQTGKSIIIEFGNFTSTFCYLLIANIITRRIHKLYMQQTEKFLGSKQSELEPKKLMIVIEEAHKFLNPVAASQTIFGIIAREMRKYYVSLFVIDQRPSGIDPEIISQIGTKVIAQLSDEKDIAAILTGAAHSQTLKQVLSTLDSKRQALVIGHAVAMPIVIQTRMYDQEFYAAMAELMSNRSHITAHDLF